MSRECWVNTGKAAGTATLDTNIESLLCDVPGRGGEVLAFGVAKARPGVFRTVWKPSKAWACSVAWPEEGKGTAATFEIWLRLFWPWLHRDEAPGTTLTQWDTVRNTDLQGSPLPAAGRAEGQGGRVLYAHFPKGPQTHPWQCAASMPTSSPMRLSSGGWERCRHTTRSS